MQSIPQLYCEHHEKLIKYINLDNYCMEKLLCNICIDSKNL